MSSSPSSSNSDKTFTITPEDNLSYSTVYRIRISTGTNDSSGNSLTSQWTTSSGFQTGTEPDTTPPTVSSISPTDNQSWVSISDNISVTFSESMVNTSVTTNTSNTSCTGSIQLSSDNFSSCLQMSSSPASSNSNKTFTLDPPDNLTYSTSYKIRVTTGVKDASGNTMSSQYETSNGFTTSGIFVISGNNNLDLSIYLTSTDNGTTWTLRTLSGDQQFLGLGYGNGTFLMGGGEHKVTDKNNILTSSDGFSWTLRTFPNGLPDKRPVMGFGYGNNIFVSVYPEGRIFTSSDAVSWDNRTDTSVSSRNINEVAFGNNTFVAVGAYGTIVTSSDNGTTWDNRTSGSIDILEDVAFGNNTFLATGYVSGVNSGIILSSSDNGTSWDNVTTVTNQTFSGVAYGNDTFVVVGNSGTILSSSDNGTTWDNRTNSSVTSNYLRHVGFGNDVFVAVGGNGTIVTSSDNGTTWTSRTSGFSNTLYNVIYSE